MAYLEIVIIGIVVALACSVVGVFLVLRQMSMMTDAITHTILLGIVVGFLATGNLHSPLLIILASAMGVLTVYLIELLQKTRLVSEDSAIGIVFPLLFSVAIILISRYAGKVNLDTDTVLLGEIAFAPFDRMIIFGRDFGSKAAFTMGSILFLNIAVVTLFFKELKICIFDKALAAALGFSPALISYLLMTLVSITTVGAFEAVGSILLIAFMVGAPITAYLITDNLKNMIFLSALISIVNVLIGNYFAFLYDVSIAGMMATVTGITFAIVFVLSPKRGFIATLLRRSRQRKKFALISILVHIHNHEKDFSEIENGVDTIHEHINRDKSYVEQMLKEHIRNGNLTVVNNTYVLTERGRGSLEF